MNCMLETGSVKIKVERPDSEEETINEQITGEAKKENPADRCKGRGAAHQPRQKLKTTSHRKSNGIEKKLDASDMVIKTEHDEDEEEDDVAAQQECDSDMDRVRVDKVKVKLKVCRKKRKEQRRPEMAELIVGRRMASLNASAMMQVGRGPGAGRAIYHTGVTGV
jgi:hypothetical protein